MVKFGDQTLPKVQSWSINTRRFLVEKSIPYRDVAYREDMGGSGKEIIVEGIISPADYDVRNDIIDVLTGEGSVTSVNRTVVGKNSRMFFLT